MSKNNIPTKYIIFLIVIILSILGVIVVSNINSKNEERKQEKVLLLEAKEQHILDSLRTIEINDSLKQVEIDKTIFKGKILPGQGFVPSLVAIEGISINHALNISNKLRFNVDYRYLRAGEEFTVTLSKDSSRVEKFVYHPDIVTFHNLSFDSVKNELVYDKVILPTEVKYSFIEGDIKTSLNQALIEKVGVSDFVKRIVNNVLECVVNFRTDARENDSYKILIKERYFKGEKLHGGEVLYASYEGKRAGFSEAYKYVDDEENSAYSAHYTKKGKALVHSALRLPIDKIHVTSSYGWRTHPVTGRKSFHNGVDYRGRIGAPVYAVAKGKVITSTYDKLSGNKIVLRHSDGTRTYYLHLSKRIAKVGDYVKPKQLIGKVGKTGRVTGSHLHFGIKNSKGRYVNPSKKRMIATPQLKGKRFKSFNEQMLEIDKIIKSVTNRVKPKVVLF